jgi:UDP-glucose 4-epimerase
LNEMNQRQRSVFITGAGGYVGSQLAEALAGHREDIGCIVAADVREAPLTKRHPGVHYVTMDVRSPQLVDAFKTHHIDTVVHLASIVTPGRRSSREFEYSVDVEGTQNVLKASLGAGVENLIVTSSGAAYGYHSDNPDWLDEDDALRGNPEFAYSDHKRIVEEMLARHRKDHPQLRQLIFRPGTILGKTAANQFTALLDKRFVIGLKGAASPFVIIWDQDVIACILKGIHQQASGIYNLAGDGVLTMKEIARLLSKPYLPLPVSLVRTTLAVLKTLGLTQYGPEQVDFLRYRPVLSNRRLKEEFGYTPRKTTREVFEYYLACKGKI